MMSASRGGVKTCAVICRDKITASEGSARSVWLNTPDWSIYSGLPFKLQEILKMDWR